MVNRQLLKPESIAIIGASNNVHKPGGAIVKNLISGGYKGTLLPVNPKEKKIQGIDAYNDITLLPGAELAILCIPAALCPDAVEILARDKHVKAFIIISAGFGEETHAGALLEKKILDTCEKYGAALIGPNCIGYMNQWHHSVFTQPIPKLKDDGADLISGSGATCCYILEAAISKGLHFNSIWSVGNGKQIGVEDVLQFMDEHYEDEDHSGGSNIKLLYIENIADPDRLLFHASSLIRKGCRIAAIKSGTSESGSRAASSHTGAIASSDSAVEALFRKAGIIRCFGREELVTVGCILTLPQLNGRNIAIITHAGGPAVMLTDALSKGGLVVPPFTGEKAEELKSKLLPGSSVGNPIDILATGSAEQLGISIDYCDKVFDNIDAIIVIFGTPGLVTVFEAYNMLHEKMLTCHKPIIPILPSPHTAGKEVEDFLSKGHVSFSDEVSLASALIRILNTPKPATGEIELFGVDVPKIRSIIDKLPTPCDKYIEPTMVRELMRAAGLPLVREIVSNDEKELADFATEVGFPVVAKVVGPVHKSDVGGVSLNIQTVEHLNKEIRRMKSLPNVTAIMIQPMLKGRELFVGAKYESRFGHVVLCGLGGIFVEVLKDVSSGLAPLSYSEAYNMIHSLRGYKIIKGTRGQKGVNEEKFAEVIVRLSTLLRFATEIKEMDINPLLATEHDVFAVDARMRIVK
jgi:acyl-CoA synthetase (NDP forming)